MTTFLRTTSHPILAAVLETIGPMHSEGRVFWEALAVSAPDLCRADAVMRRCGLKQFSTYQSRFERAGLPSVKALLSGYRLCLAAWMFDRPGFETIASVAYPLNFASPQAFNRWVRLMLGVTATTFRDEYPFNLVLSDYIERMIQPNAHAWATFLPISGTRPKPGKPKWVEHRCPECFAPVLAGVQ